MFFQSRMQLKIAVGLILLNLPLGWLICSNPGTVVEFQDGFLDFFEKRLHWASVVHASGVS